jgi:hypothetical protein
MEDNLDANYELVTDIDASQTAQFNNESGFDPVGVFTGTFDGNDHTVTELTINRPDESGVGLFGATGNGATIRNITLAGTTVTGDFGVGGLIGENEFNAIVADATVSGNVTGETDVGGLVGRNFDATIQTATTSGSVNGEGDVGGLVGSNSGGNISNSSARVDVTGGSITGGLVGFNVDSARVISSFATGSVNGTTFVGGLAGVNFENGLVLNSHATGNVTGESNTGGLIGDNNAAVVSQSYATGTVGGAEETGGLVGDNFNGALISSSYATGAVFGGSDVGGLVGNNDNNQNDVVDQDEAQTDGTVIKSFATGTLSGENNVGGLVGESTSGEVEDSYWDEQSTGVSVSAGSAIGLTTPQMQGQSAPTNMAELDFENTWTSTDGYPALLMRTIESRDATLQTDSISIPDTVTEGERAEVTATVKNTGGVSAVLTLGLIQNGTPETVDSAQVTVRPSTTESVLLSTQLTQVGDQQLVVEGPQNSVTETVTVANTSGRELVIQPPSQIVRDEPFAVKILNTSEVAVSGVNVTLSPNPSAPNRTQITNASGIAVFELQNDSTVDAVRLTASPDGLPAYDSGDQLTITGIRDPGDLQLGNLSVRPTTLPRNNSIVVSVDITNTNPTELNQTLSLAAAGTRTLTATTITIPGETTQTVTLTPTLTTLGTKNITVNGQSAGTVTVTEVTPPTVELGTPRISETLLPIELNATTGVNVTVPVTNVGDVPGQFVLELTVGDLSQTRAIELSAAENRTVTFPNVTGGLVPRSKPYALTVSTANATFNTTLSVSNTDTAGLSITDTRFPGRVTNGDRFTVSARVGNFGPNVTTDELTLALDTDRDGSFETVTQRQRTLRPNTTTPIAFQATATAAGTGQLPFRLTTDGDSITGNISVASTEFTTAVSTGDPHIVSFDGVAYDFQAAGEFILAREPTDNGSLVVQARQEPLAGSDSITRNTAVATVVDDQTVIIDATDAIPLQINGSQVELNRSETVVVGNGTIDRNNNRLTVTYPGSDTDATTGDEHLTVDLYDDRVDVELNLDPERDRPVEGVFGPADGNITNDISLPNGTALAQPPQAEQLYGVFRESWRVNNSTTLFTYESDNGPETYYNPTIPAEAVSTADLDRTTRIEAEQRAIDAGLQPGTVAFRNAVLDFALTGDASYLTSAQQQNTSVTTNESIGAPTESTVRVESASLGPGGTADVNLTLERAPQGLAGYNLTAAVSVAETSGVRFIDARAPGVFNNSVTETTLGPENQTVEIRATDITTAIESNETNVLLGSVTVVATESANVSQTDVTVRVSQIDDDTGDPINIETQNGTISVTEQAPLAENLSPPTDPDNDGVFEDINGNGRLDFSDVVALFENLPDARAPFQDFNDNGRIDFDDIVELFKQI